MKNIFKIGLVGLGFLLLTAAAANKETRQAQKFAAPALGALVAQIPSQFRDWMPMVPPVFKQRVNRMDAIPTGFGNDAYTVRPIAVEDYKKDYEALNASREHLHKNFSAPGDPWPEDDLNEFEDSLDLWGHVVDARLRNGFTYTIEAAGGKRTLGCIYIYPTNHPKFEAQVTMWVRQDSLQ